MVINSSPGPGTDKRQIPNAFIVLKGDATIKLRGDDERSGINVSDLA